MKKGYSIYWIVAGILGIIIMLVLLNYKNVAVKSGFLPSANLSFITHMFKSSDAEIVRVCSQEERLALVRSMCEKYGNPGSKYGKTLFTIDPTNKVAFKDIAKIGSSTWLTIMANLSMNGTLSSRHGSLHTSVINRYGLHRTSFNAHEIQTNLTGYTKFVVVRNPLYRLYSGYNNKIVKSKPSGFRNGLKKYLKMNISLSEIPSFEGFLQMIVSERGLSRDPHFQNYFCGVNPCFMDYDYILKLETQDQDLNLFLSNVYKLHNTSFYVNVHVNNLTSPIMTDSAVNHETYLQKYDEIPDLLLSKVIEKFKYEFDFFGYTFNTETSTANCGLQQKCC